MVLTPVESSHIAAIGYLDAERILIVRYKDGTLYAQADFSSSKWKSLQAAPSKGRWLHTRDRRGVDPIRITKGANSVDQGIPERAGRETTTDPGPLNVIDEDADACCRKGLTHRLQRDSETRWECGECGTQLYPEIIGACRYWRIKSNVVIVRK